MRAHTKEEDGPAKYPHLAGECETDRYYQFTVDCDDYEGAFETALSLDLDIPEEAWTWFDDFNETGLLVALEQVSNEEGLLPRTERALRMQHFHPTTHERLERYLSFLPENGGREIVIYVYHVVRILRAMALGSAELALPRVELPHRSRRMDS